jgi:hypothetical protein
MCTGEKDVQEKQVAVNKRLANIRQECKRHGKCDALAKLSALDSVISKIEEIKNQLSGLREALGDLYFCHEELDVIHGLANFALKRIDQP